MPCETQRTLAPWIVIRKSSTRSRTCAADSPPGAVKCRGSFSAPGDKVQVVDLFHLELPQPGRDQLSANFIDGVGSVKGRCKVTLEHRRRVLRVLVHQPDNGLGIRRAYKIDQQHWRARLR